MSEVESQLAPNWLSMSESMRWESDFGIALGFFWSGERESRRVYGSLSVESYVTREAQWPVLDEPDFYYDAIACILAVHLPDFVLLSLSTNLTGSEEWQNARKQLLASVNVTQRGLHDISLEIDAFSAKFSPDRENANLRTHYARQELIQISLVKVYEDPRFRIASLSALLTSRAETSESLGHEKGTKNLNPQVAAESPSSSIERYTLARQELAIKKREASDAYATFSVPEVLVVRGRRDLIGAVVAWLALFYCLVVTISGRSISFISQARGEVSTSPSEHHAFQLPPLGLSQTIWTVMVVVFYLYLITVLSVFLWKGYLAKEKSETAADVVKSLVSIGVGVFFGKIAGSFG